MRNGLIVALLALLALLACAAPAQAQDVVVNFDDPAAQPGKSANDIYLSSPGFIFGSGVENPEGGEFPTYRSCGTLVDTVSTAPSKPHVARLVCGGTPEFPDPPVLFGKMTTESRSRVSVTVGDSGNGKHVMRLSAYDGRGRLLNRSPSVPIAAAGTKLEVTAGQPEITYFIVEETGNSVSSGVWIDDLTVDTPPVKGQPSFGIVRTAGKGNVVVRQGAGAETDISIYRINESEGNVNFSVAGLPAGVSASFSKSVNGQTLRLRAGVNAPVTGATDPVIIVTGTPQDGNTGTVKQRVSVPIRIIPAITVSARVGGSVGLPACDVIILDYDVAEEAGPAKLSLAPLPPGVTALINGVEIGAAPAVSGRGTAALAFRLTSDVTAEVAATLSLTGRAVYDPVTFSTQTYKGTSGLALRGLRPLTELTPTAGRTPQQLQPGTTVRVRADDPCARPSARLRFGNDKALAPITSVDGKVLTAQVPRMATSGNVQLVSLDAAGAITPGRAEGPRMEIDNYRNTVGFAFSNYKPRLTIDQMVAAFGREQVYFTPNICGALSFGFISCKVGTPIPDPWAMVVLEIANRTMGGSSGGSCFGISLTGQELRKGTRSLKGLGDAGATNAFTLGGGGVDVPPGGINEAINANHLKELSEDYLDYYAKQAVGNVLSQNPGLLRRELEGYLRRGDHPLLSLRDGGSVDRLHVVVAYDVYTDPVNPGAYYVDVYDSNTPFLNVPTTLQTTSGPQTIDEVGADGLQHEFRHGRSRIHVRNDGSWSMPSSNYGGRTVDNIIASGFGTPPPRPKLITAGGALKSGFTILFGWAASGLVNLRAAEDPVAGSAAADPRGEETPPGEVTQITSGGRRLYSEPGVINKDPATALRATPWSPSTANGDGAETSEGFLLAAGPGAAYEVEVKGDRNAPQTRTVMGDNMVAEITTSAKSGVTDAFSVVPRLDQVGYDPGSGSAPLNVQMMVRAGDGSTRTFEADTTTTGSDKVSFDASEDRVVIDHKGAPATVALTLSATGKSSLPRAATARIKLDRNAKATLEPASWNRLGEGKLTVRSKGRTRQVTLRRKQAVGAKVTGVAVTGKGQARVANVRVRVPASVTSGTATVSYILRRGKRVVASSSAGAGAAGSRTLSWKLPRNARPGDRVIAAVTTLVARGSSFNSAVSQREAKVR